MSDKPTNGAGAEDKASEAEFDDAPATETDAEAADEDDDGEEIPVEVEDADTRPVKVPDLGAALDDGAAEAVEVAGESETLSHEDLLELVGQAEQEKAALQEKLEAAEQAKKEHYERLLLSAADMENLRKRTRKDIEDSKLDVRAKVLKEILPVIDNLDRALQHAQKTTDNTQGIIEGVTLVLRQFQQALERLDVKLILARGAPFDPNIHEAVSQVPTDEVPPGSVVEVLQRGYTIGPRLLRPSLVVVAQAPPAAAEPAEAEPDTEASKGNGETDPIAMPPADDEEAEAAEAEPESETDSEPEPESGQEK